MQRTAFGDADMCRERCVTVEWISQRTAGPRPQGSYIQPATGDLLAGEYVQQPEEAPVDRGSRRILQRSAVESGSGSSSKDTRIIDRAFTLLGFAEGNVQDASEFDLVFVHAVMENTASKLGKLGMKTDLNRLDKLVASVMEAAPVGSAVTARIHVSVILSYGSATANKEEESSSNATGTVATRSNTF